MLQVFALGELGAGPARAAGAPGRPCATNWDARRPTPCSATSTRNWPLRLDALFAATYDSILADPPVAGGAAAARRRRRPGPRARRSRPRRTPPTSTTCSIRIRRYVRRARSATRPSRRVPPTRASCSTWRRRTRKPRPNRSRSQPESEAQAGARAQLSRNPKRSPTPAPEPAASRTPPSAETALASEPVFSENSMPPAAGLPGRGGRLAAADRQRPAPVAAKPARHATAQACCAPCTPSRAARGWPARCASASISRTGNPGREHGPRRDHGPAAFDELLANYDQALLLFEQLQQPAPAPEAAPAQGRRAAPPRPPTAGRAHGAGAVRADILDRLVNQAGEVSITRSKLENQVGG